MLIKKRIIKGIKIYYYNKNNFLISFKEVGVNFSDSIKVQYKVFEVLLINDVLIKFMVYRINIIK